MNTQTRPTIHDLAGSVDLLAVVEKDVPALAGTFNGRYTIETACPWCRGDTRFRYRLCDDGIGRVFCSHCAPRGLNAVDYIMRRDGVTLAEACQFWTAPTYSAPAAAETVRTTTRPAAVGEIAPGATWQDHARAFAAACHEWLFTAAGAPARQYLHGRGLTDDTLRRFMVGANPTARSKPGASWGLTRPKVYAAMGITLPRFILGELWAVNIRRMNPDWTPYHGDDKYICVSGSRLGLAGADQVRDARAVIVFGGELDYILAAQHAPADVACVTFGGEGHGIGETWRNVLHGKPLYVCMDNDDAGDRGAAKWARMPKARRARVPSGKDLTEFWQAGGDVAGWIESVVWNDDELMDAMLTWAESKGYVPTFNPTGAIVCSREVGA